MATSKISQLPVLDADTCTELGLDASDISCAVIHLSAGTTDVLQTSQMSLADVAGTMCPDYSVVTESGDIDISGIQIQKSGMCLLKLATDNDDVGCSVKVFLSAEEWGSRIQVAELTTAKGSMTTTQMLPVRAGMQMSIAQNNGYATYQVFKS